MVFNALLFLQQDRYKADHIPRIHSAVGNNETILNGEGSDNKRHFSTTLQLKSSLKARGTQTEIDSSQQGSGGATRSEALDQTNSNEPIHQNGAMNVNKFEEALVARLQESQHGNMFQDRRGNCTRINMHHQESVRPSNEEENESLCQNINYVVPAVRNAEQSAQNSLQENGNASLEMNGFNGAMLMPYPQQTFLKQPSNEPEDTEPNDTSDDCKYRGIIQVRNTPLGVVPYAQQYDHLRGQSNFFPAVFQQNVSHNYTYYAPGAQSSISSTSPSELSSLPEDEYSGTNMSERSLNTLMSKAILYDDDVRNLGLELDFSSAMIQKFINQNSNNPQVAAFKLVLEWRNSRSKGSKEEKCTVLHDALVETGKIAQAEVVCSQSKSCRHHKS